MTTRPLVQAFARVRMNVALLREDIADGAATVWESAERLQVSLDELEREVLAVAGKEARA